MDKTKNSKDQENDEMLPECDFSGGVRGKHHNAHRRGHTVTIKKRTEQRKSGISRSKKAQLC